MYSHGQLYSSLQTETPGTHKNSNCFLLFSSVVEQDKSLLMENTHTHTNTCIYTLSNWSQTLYPPACSQSLFSPQHLCSTSPLQLLTHKHSSMHIRYPCSDCPQAFSLSSILPWILSALFVSQRNTHMQIDPTKLTPHCQVMDLMVSLVLGFWHPTRANLQTPWSHWYLSQTQLS